jgi:uncharacterized protein (TIGR03067 family)
MRSCVLFDVTFALAVFVCAVPAQDNAGKTDSEKLQGTWVVTSFEDASGKASNKDIKGWTYRFEGNKFTVTWKRKTEPEDTFKLDEGKKPKEIDVMIGDQKASGIYDLEGDRLIIRIYFDGTMRPKSIAGALGKFESRTELKRQKK